MVMPTSNTTSELLVKVIGLKQQLDRTKKKLDIAVDALKECLSNANNSMVLDAVRFHCIKNTAEIALEQIKEQQ